MQLESNPGSKGLAPPHDALKKSAETNSFDFVLHRSFPGDKGETEHFFAVTAPSGGTLKKQIENVQTNYSNAIRSLGLVGHETPVFRRIFLSDAPNQAESVFQCDLADKGGANPVAVSIVQQPPLPSSKIALLAYHIEGPKPLIKRRLSPQHLLIPKNGFGHLWSTQICGHKNSKPLVWSLQTRQVFEELSATLSSQGGSLYQNCLRVWLFIKDIDMFYGETVDERRALFLRHGLTSETHFIASTGIGGTGLHPQDLVHLDAYSILGIQPKQISYLTDSKMLCSANDYHVPFERGTCIRYADRSHIFISGTASIDHRGSSLHPGNVQNQLHRTLENIDALLQDAEASLADLMYIIVYLRDAADFECVRAELSRQLPFVPAILVQGEVCRSEWLIEIEGFAIAAGRRPSYPWF